MLDDIIKACNAVGNFKPEFNEIPEVIFTDFTDDNKVRPTPKVFRHGEPRPVHIFDSDPDIANRAEADARRLKRWADTQLRPWMQQSIIRGDREYIGSSGLVKSQERRGPLKRAKPLYLRKRPTALWMIDSGARFHLIDPKTSTIQMEKLRNT